MQMEMELPPDFVKACEKSLGAGTRMNWDNMATLMRARLKPEEMKMYMHDFKQIIHKALSLYGSPMPQTVNKTWTRLLQRATAPVPEAGASSSSSSGSKKGGGLSKRTAEALKELEAVDPHETLMEMQRCLMKGNKPSAEDINAFLGVIGGMHELLDSLGIKNPFE